MRTYLYLQRAQGLVKETEYKQFRIILKNTTRMIPKEKRSQQILEGNNSKRLAFEKVTGHKIIKLGRRRVKLKNFKALMTTCSTPNPHKNDSNSKSFATWIFKLKYRQIKQNVHKYPQKDNLKRCCIITVNTYVRGPVPNVLHLNNSFSCHNNSIK